MSNLLFDTLFDQRPVDRVFIELADGKRWSYSDILNQTAQVANALVSMGVQPGDRVAAQVDKSVSMIALYLGVIRAGAVFLPLNTAYTASEIEYFITDAEPALLVCRPAAEAALGPIAASTATRLETLGSSGEAGSWPGLVNTCSSQFENVARGNHDLAAILYTSGTTGRAKGAMLTHRNMIANMEQASAWISEEIEESKETIITALPLYHIFSLTANCLTFMKIGALNYLITNPRDMPNFVKELKNVSFSVITGVNTLFIGLLNTPGFDEIDFSDLKFTLGGGMAVQQPVAERWARVTGSPLLEAYGLTETSPAVCINPLNLAEYNGSIGLPISSTEVSIQDENGNLLPQGESGELCVRGPQVMKGYWNREEATANVLSADGWLKTGDVAKMDTEGFFRIVDRIKDMILVSGFNVYPNEVESIIAGHEGVLEVGVIGVPDGKRGEVVKAVIVRKDPSLTEEDVIAHCRKDLTAYKVPRIVEFRDELPKTNVGKILRRELRD